MNSQHVASDEISDAHTSDLRVQIMYFCKSLMKVVSSIIESHPRDEYVELMKLRFISLDGAETTEEINILLYTPGTLWHESPLPMKASLNYLLLIQELCKYQNATATLTTFSRLFGIFLKFWLAYLSLMKNWFGCDESDVGKPSLSVICQLFKTPQMYSRPSKFNGK